MGEALTVNKGWDMARGEYGVIVNADDPVLPGLVASCVAYLEQRPDVLVAYPDWNMIDSAGELCRHIQVFEYDSATWCAGITACRGRARSFAARPSTWKAAAIPSTALSVISNTGCGWAFTGHSRVFLKRSLRGAFTPGRRHRSEGRTNGARAPVADG